MGIITRIIRLLKADIHGVMDHLEDKELILNQCLREMEEDIYNSEAGINNISASIERIEKDYTCSLERLEKIETDIKEAIKREKDDIARFLIKRRKAAKYHVKELKEHIEATGRELLNLKEILEDKRLSFDKLKFEAQERIRLEKLKKENPPARGTTGLGARSMNDGEVELELLKFKEALAADG